MTAYILTTSPACECDDVAILTPAEVDGLKQGDLIEFLPYPADLQGTRKNMQPGYVKTETRGNTDRLLALFSRQLIERGNRLIGVAKTNTECADSTLCDMDL